MEAVIFEYEASIRDVRRYYLWLMFRSKYYYLYMGSFLLIACRRLVEIDWNNIDEMRVQALLVFCSVVIVLPFLFIMSLARKAIAASRKKGSRTIRIDKEGIRVSSQDVDAVAKWAGCTYFLRLHELIVIEGTAKLLLAKRDFSEEDFRNIIQWLSEAPVKKKGMAGGKLDNM